MSNAIHVQMAHPRPLVDPTRREPEIKQQTGCGVPLPGQTSRG
jgi:hypothetical protein